MLKNLATRSHSHAAFRPDVNKRYFEYTAYATCAWVLCSELPMVAKLATCAIALGSVLHIKNVTRNFELVDCRLDKD